MVILLKSIRGKRQIGTQEVAEERSELLFIPTQIQEPRETRKPQNNKPQKENHRINNTQLK